MVVVTEIVPSTGFTLFDAETTVDPVRGQGLPGIAIETFSVTAPGAPVEKVICRVPCPPVTLPLFIVQV